MKDVLTGRVDLVRALTSGGTELQEAVAHLLGFEREEEKPPPPQKVETEPKRPPEPPPEPEAAPLHVDVPFWLAHDFAARQPRPGDEPPPVELVPPKKVPVRLPPAALASGAAILTHLRRYSGFSDLSGGVDIDRTVSSLSKGQWLRHFPRRPRKRWGQTIQVIGDRSRRLAPFWLDQDFAISQLKRVYPRDGFQLAILEAGASVPRTLLPPGQSGSYRLPDPGTIVLVLGDLGCLARQKEERERLARFWLEWGRRFRAHGNPALALVPCHPSHCRGELSRLWTVLPWEGVRTHERPPLSDREMEAVSDQVITRLAFALRVEPRLVRAVRHMLPEGRVDAGIESYVWQHGAFQSRHHEAATFDPDSMRRLLPEFFRLPEAERRRVYDFVRELHSELYPGVWFAELLALERDVARGLLDQDEIRQAARWYLKWLNHLKENGAANDRAANEPTWFRRVFARLPESVNQGSAARILHEIWEVVRPDEEVKNLPDFLDPALLPPSTNPERLVALRQVADRLIAESFFGNECGGSRGVLKEDKELPGSLLGLIRTRNGLIRIERLDEFWDGGVPPDWASAWGWGEHGAWVSLRLEEATQRLRWIPPGRFLMGSPEDEEGRYSDEGPRHEERISTGFWLFDTPCTQALWEAVMGANPSHFKAADRPVERVSRDDCQEFLRRLNGRLVGLELGLPSEAQWEYACRAVTESARYHANLEEIAWYAENSGGETHAVGGKLPNGWGLYDMLGNVWEWCADPWREDYSFPRAEEPGVGASVPRVIRGGSWHNAPQIVRAAFRVHSDPSDRDDDLGFRCAEFRAPGPAGRSRDAERVGSEAEQGAEHREDRAPTSGAAWLRPGERAEESDSMSISVLAPIRVSTDLESLTIRPVSLPPWASAIGRDRYGLWAEFTIDPPPPQKSRSRGTARKRRPQALAPAPVRQRLRWIPPGRFLMGSPEDEEGRWSAEGPRHEKSIDPGFWLFDTPCTQALWEAVMGANPSRFKAPDRPVEQVSWIDCQEFVSRLNGRLVGLELGLPSEAQWEYACRAGTESARYHANLDEIAWYAENSGGETHAVGGKLSNGWGLYDMLGNVWEWCADPWREDYSVPRAGEPGVGASVPRVIRGGSWRHVALHARAAFRFLLDPSHRLGPLGFRCAEFKAGS